MCFQFLDFKKIYVYSLALGLLAFGAIHAHEGAETTTKRNNPGCNILFPKRGPTGPTGATGLPGAPGAQGPIGPQGPSGISAAAAYASGTLAGNITGGVITQPTFTFQSSNQNVTVFDNSHYQINVPGDYLIMVSTRVQNNTAISDIITLNLLINDVTLAGITAQTIPGKIVFGAAELPGVDTFTIQLIRPLAQSDRLSVTFNSAIQVANETVAVQLSLQKVSLQP